MKLFKNLTFGKWKFKRILLISSFVLFLVLASIFGSLKIWISYDAKTFAEDAIEVFQKEKIESLIALIDSDMYSLKEKNKAVWTMGILKDKRALAKLESLATETECNHSEEICQYEIQKAILKINGEFKGSWQASR